MYTKLLAIAIMAAGLLSVCPVLAQMAPSTNLSGESGIIDMPSGVSMPDGWLTLNYGRFGGIGRTTLSFQISPRLSGSFRYVGIRNWNAEVCPPKCSGANAFETYYDRNFDLRYQILDEGKYLPSVTIGLQDFIGTSLSSAEYIAATKNFGDRLRVTAGLGFGRLGSYGSIGKPFGDRPPIEFGLGGTVNAGQWFRGKAAPFGGIEYKFADKWVFKVEYSSNAYRAEAENRGVFDRASPLNFGVEYQGNANLRAAVYSLYGSEVGVNLTILLNPAQRPAGGVGGKGPIPIKPRPAYASNPAMYTTDWVDQPNSKPVLINGLNKNLEREAIYVESLSVTTHTAQVRFRNTLYDASAQAVGRVARAMALTLPSSIDTFEIVPLSNGLAGAKVTVRRSDLERLEFTPDPAGSLLASTVIAPAGRAPRDSTYSIDRQARFNWTLTPWAQTMLFDPAEPLQIIGGASLRAKYEITPGVYLSGSMTQTLLGDFILHGGGETSLPRVRSRAASYYADGQTAVTTLTIAAYRQLGRELYGRVTVGYLEQMFGGISTEVLYQPVNSRWAIGADLNYVAQRNTDGGFGFDQFNYRVLTGHVSGYYDFGNGYDVRLDVGRYLAGDVGGTLTLMRNFSNGWKIGAFATKTSASAAAFGEGSFDKGIVMQIPLTYFTGKPSRTVRPFVLRPLSRDGGARLQVNDRLRDTLRGTTEDGLTQQWGRFWK